MITLVDLTQPIDSPTRSQFVAGMPADRPNTTFVHAGIDQPAISGDGRYVAYRSDAASAEAVPDWGDGPVAGAEATQQVFVWDRDEADPFLAVRLVSVRPNGAPLVAGASEPALSRDGRVVAFTSADVGLVPAVFPQCESICPTQVYRLDRDTDRNGWLDEPNGTSLSLVSAEPGVEPAVAGTAPSSQPTLSADGELVVFVSKAPNLQLIQTRVAVRPPTATCSCANVSTNELRRLTVASDGVRPTVGAHARPAISDTGRTTVFDTLVAGEFLAEQDVVGRHVVALDVRADAVARRRRPRHDRGRARERRVVRRGDQRGPVELHADRGLGQQPGLQDQRRASTCTLGSNVPPGGDCTVRSRSRRPPTARPAGR